MTRQACTCGAVYRFPESAVGKRAKCKKCGAVFTLEDDAEGPIPIADEPDAANGVGRVPLVSNGGGAIPTTGMAGTSVVVEEAPRPRSYFASLLDTLTFLKRGHNLITFVFVWAVLCTNALLSMIRPFGWILQLAIMGWYCAYRFEVILEAVAGEDDLPSLTYSGSLWEDVVVPWFKWSVSWLIVLVPSVIGLIVVLGTGSAGMAAAETILKDGIGGIVQAGLVGEALVYAILLFAGLFMWPIVVLCVAVGGFSTLSRIDLMIATIVKTFPVYALTVAIVYGAEFLGAYFEAGSRGLLRRAGTIGVGLYLEIVALRMIGLYYHHFKQRFAWSWE